MHCEYPENGAGKEQNEGVLPANDFGEEWHELDGDHREQKSDGGLHCQGCPNNLSVNGFTEDRGEHTRVGNDCGAPNQQKCKEDHVVGAEQDW